MNQADKNVEKARRLFDAAFTEDRDVYDQHLICVAGILQDNLEEQPPTQEDAQACINTAANILRILFGSKEIDDAPEPN